MGKALIIAEKPSVASDIAKALGGFSKHDDYFESDKYVLSSAVGHLLELIVPEEFEVKRGKWTFAHLPVIPPHFGLRPIEVELMRGRQIAADLAIVGRIIAGRLLKSIISFAMLLFLSRGGATLRVGWNRISHDGMIPAERHRHFIAR